MVTVYGIVPGSDSDKKGIKAGDKLHTVNGNEITDVLDYRFYLTDKKVRLQLERDGKAYEVEIEKEMYADIGLEFETYLIDKQHSCRNRCIFCFIDQLPEGMRKSLYFKDDDSRMSFLMGNYVTLTNLTDSDIDRIIKMRLSPINISVHTTNPALRVEMMKNKRAGEVLKYLGRLSEAGIELNLQIVLCKGINDGSELDRTMRELTELPALPESVSVVPAGLTKFREKLYPLEPFTESECASVLKQVNDFGDKCREKFGRRIFFCGDEFYIKSGTDFPDEDFYEGYPQIENGVGMITSMEAEFSDALSVSGSELTEQKTVSVATGYAAYEFICRLAEEVMEKVKGLRVNVYRIRNDWFGENITVAGLLTATDIINQLRTEAEKGNLGETLVLSSSMLKADENIFLDDKTPYDIERELGVKVRFSECSGDDFLAAITGQ